MGLPIPVAMSGHATQGFCLGRRAGVSRRPPLFAQVDTPGGPHVHRARPRRHRASPHKRLTASSVAGYRRDIQGALYFPLISPPASAWLTRALLYWDQVGTIVPQSWVESPELLGAHTLELVQRGLLLQVF